MPKRVLDVGNCGPDHAAIRQLLRSFDCEVLQADDARGALAALKNGGVDLVLVNRKLDVDYSDGIEVIRQIKADPAVAKTPVMLLTNYPEHQDSAEALGAIRGFGKLEFQKPETRQRLEAVLGPPSRT
jgi:CheY-like chemotaxis protein